MRDKLVTQGNTVTLDLSYSSLEDKDTPKLLEYLKENPYISILKINNTAITDIAGIELAKKLNVNSLDISWTNISSVTAMMMADNQFIESLNMSFNYIGDEGIVAIAVKPNNITHLDVRYTGATAKSAKALADKITLYFLNIGNHIPELIDGCECPVHKAELYYRNRNQITDEGATALAQSKTIKRLDASMNNIGYRGVVALAKNTVLTGLNLSNSTDIDRAIELCFAYQCVIPAEPKKIGPQTHNQIKDKEAILLSYSSSLEFLDLRGNSLGLNAMTALSANTLLKELYIDRTVESIGVLTERNPLQRANNARKLGLNTAVPSLKRLSIFAAGKLGMTKEKIQEELPIECSVPLIFSKFEVIDILDGNERKVNVYCG